MHILITEPYFLLRYILETNPYVVEVDSQNKASTLGKHKDMAVYFAQTPRLPPPAHLGPGAGSGSSPRKIAAWGARRRGGHYYVQGSFQNMRRPMLSILANSIVLTNG